MEPMLTGLGRNKTLKRLGLAWNGMKGVVFAKSLETALIKNKTLEELDLESNL